MVRFNYPTGWRSPVVAIAILAAAMSVAGAQDRRVETDRQGLRDRDSWLGRMPGARLFQPAPEDYGPLTPAERRELESFVKKNAPLIYDKLKQIHKRDPEAFEQRFQESAPRLRVLRRVFEKDERLGRMIIDYAENRQRLERARDAFRRSDNDPQARRRIGAAVRRLMAENLRIEAAVLEDRVRQMDEQHDENVQAEFDRLMSPDVDLSAESPETRASVRKLQNAQPDERQRLADELWSTTSDRMDREIETMRTRVKRMRANAPDEVDRRVQRFAAESRGRAPNAGGVRPRQGDDPPEGKRPRGGGRRKP